MAPVVHAVRVLREKDLPGSAHFVFQDRLRIFSEDKMWQFREVPSRFPEFPTGSQVPQASLELSSWQLELLIFPPTLTDCWDCRRLPSGLDSSGFCVLLVRARCMRVAAAPLGCHLALLTVVAQCFGFRTGSPTAQTDLRSPM